MLAAHWSELSFPPPGDPSTPGFKPVSPGALALASEFFTTEPPGNPRIVIHSTKLTLLSL